MMDNGMDSGERAEMNMSTAGGKQIYMKSVCVKPREMWQNKQKKPHIQGSFEPRPKSVSKVGSISAVSGQSHLCGASNCHTTNHRTAG